jgi:hypothetical protein
MICPAGGVLSVIFRSKHYKNNFFFCGVFPRSGKTPPAGKIIDIVPVGYEQLFNWLFNLKATFKLVCMGGQLRKK